MESDPRKDEVLESPSAPKENYKMLWECYQELKLVAESAVGMNGTIQELWWDGLVLLVRKTLAQNCILLNDKPNVEGSLKIFLDTLDKFRNAILEEATRVLDSDSAEKIRKLKVIRES